MYSSSHKSTSWRLPTIGKRGVKPTPQEKPIHHKTEKNANQFVCALQIPFEFVCALRTRDGGTERFGTRLRNCKGIADPRSPPRASFQTPATSLSCEHPFQPVRHSISRYQRPYTVTQRPHGYFDYAANSPRFYRYRVIDQQYTKQSEIDQSRGWTKIVASLLYFLVLGIPA